MTNTEPAERGEAYIAIMRDLAETTHDRALHDHYAEELHSLTRPIAHMSAGQLIDVLNGIHAALYDTLNDLITARKRNQHTERHL